MNFTDSPYERMMKQVPRRSRHDPEPCPAGSAAAIAGRSGAP